jgi:hypothetical protein
MENQMMDCRYIRGLLGVSALFAIAAAAPVRASEVEGYTFTNAAQEITQLFWLAETASACGWAGQDEAAKFKLFAVRFLAAHLSEANQRALISLVTEPNYEAGVRRAAEEGARDNCGSRRWQLGWASYKQAADENEKVF